MNSNRVSKTSYPPAGDGSCTTTTTPATTSYSYDNADRLQPSGDHAGLTYDAFGRITTLPATDGNGTSTSLAYYATDMVKSTSQNAASRSWTLDPGMRLRAMTAEPGNSTATINHYATTTDAPAWTSDTSSTGATSTTRNLTDLTGALAATASTGTATWQLTGLHGDIERTTSPAATTTPDGTGTSTDEYGAPTGSTTHTPTYGYLGAQQRANDPLTSLTYMGVRMYAPGMGSFLQTDPILGGNTTPYGYPTNPVNLTDTTGQFVLHYEGMHFGWWGGYLEWKLWFGKPGTSWISYYGDPFKIFASLLWSVGYVARWAGAAAAGVAASVVVAFAALGYWRTTTVANSAKSRGSCIAFDIRWYYPGQAVVLPYITSTYCGGRYRNT